MLNLCAYFQNFQIGDDYCGQYEVNTPIVGTEAVSANAVLHMKGTSATSIAVMVTDEYTVAFVGTLSGDIKKVGRTIMDMNIIIAINWTI